MSTQFGKDVLQQQSRAKGRGITFNSESSRSVAELFFMHFLASLMRKSRRQGGRQPQGLEQYQLRKTPGLAADFPLSVDSKPVGKRMGRPSAGGELSTLKTRTPKFAGAAVSLITASDSVEALWFGVRQQGVKKNKQPQGILVECSLDSTLTGVNSLLSLFLGGLYLGGSEGRKLT